VKILFLILLTFSCAKKRNEKVEVDRQTNTPIDKEQVNALKLVYQTQKQDVIDAFDIDGHKVVREQMIDALNQENDKLKSDITIAKLPEITLETALKDGRSIQDHVLELNDSDYKISKITLEENLIKSITYIIDGIEVGILIADIIKEKGAK
jgi:hypothetical protein